MGRAVADVFDEYQKARLVFVQAVEELALFPDNLRALQRAGATPLLRPLLFDDAPEIRLCAANSFTAMLDHIVPRRGCTGRNQEPDDQHPARCHSRKALGASPKTKKAEGASEPDDVGKRGRRGPGRHRGPGNNKAGASASSQPFGANPKAKAKGRAAATAANAKFAKAKAKTKAKAKAKGEARTRAGSKRPAYTHI